MFTDPKPEALGMAGFGLAAALTDLLVRRGILSSDDARSLIQLAQHEIEQVVGPMKGSDASIPLDGISRRFG